MEQINTTQLNRRNFVKGIVGISCFIAISTTNGLSQTNLVTGVSIWF